MRTKTTVVAAMLALSTLVGSAVTTVGATSAVSQQQGTPIRYDAEHRVFRIDAGKVTYAFGVNGDGILQTLYWGSRLATDDPIGPATVHKERSSFDPVGANTPQEYAGWGGPITVMPDLKLHFADGNRDLILRYDSYKIENGSLQVTLRDSKADVTVALRYIVDPATGIIGRSARIENHASQPLTIDRAAAASWNLPPATDYSLRYLTGTWAGEWHVRTRPLTPGATELESRRGSTGDENNPWFAIARGAEWNESHGRVWFGALAWSGSWSIHIDQDILSQVRVTGGFNPFDFAYRLEPGQGLDTPVFYAGYTDEGIGEASRLMHKFELTRILPGSSKLKPRPVLYNSWEATEFKVNEADQERLAEKAAKLGVERFVIDDGWFGARNSDHAGLGDWVVNREKFPNGLKPLIDKVHGLDMSFGIWVEPEMVNPDSDLYRQHPDWVLNFEGRQRSVARNQLVLNLAREDVRAYVFNMLDDLLSKNDIQFLKWDYNRNWSEPGWPQMPPEQQQKVYVAYVQNLYDILRRLRERHPNVEIESCSGGGARVDLGIMGLTDEVWPSDNTDPSDRLSIQDGFSYAYAPAVMMSWVTGSPNWVNGRRSSLDFRFLASMQGGLGIGANILEWTPAEDATARAYIAAYKGIRETVLHGRLYRLLSPQDRAPQSATESVAADGSQAVLFAFLRQGQEALAYPTLYLQGLDDAAQYRYRLIHGKVAAGTPAVASGAYWKHHGIDIELRGDLDAAAVVFERVGAQKKGGR
ncbi:alpha-galactosidase [Luteibacter rhizovicinus]|uniref:Alpha-galactosidase n=1 Tax=Luteibacter rhizovicinus TaxID=242606 RepID=A0A4R3YQJ4_9GAMM|nr:alpha-galactosidase [Luteibacter rhizovicinus]TCV94690.1 alpha-galactosidase [Luteibacter rhizovicinus]